MEELPFILIVLALGVAAQVAVLRVHAWEERRILNFSLAFHALSAFALILIYRYYYPGGDIIGYEMNGIMLADALRYDLGDVLPETLKIFAHVPSLKLTGAETPSSTDSMQMVAGWLMFLFGDSLYASSLFVALLSYAGKLAMYAAVKNGFPSSSRLIVLGSLTLVPSGVFWTSALLKEPIAMVCFGPMFLGLHWIRSGRRPILGWPFILAGAFGVAMIKPYVLLAFGIAVAVWFSWPQTEAGRARLFAHPWRLASGVVVGLLLYTLASSYFAKGNSEDLAQSMAQQRHAAATVAGGSNFEIEGGTAADGSGPVSTRSQLVLAPLALGTALFRPFLFEVRNVMQFATALETTWILILFVQVLLRLGPYGAVRKLLSSPALMLCAVFTVLLGLGTGLASSNLGALARYRAPMMPFWVLLLLVLRETGRSRESQLSAAPRTASLDPPLSQ